MSEKQRGCNIKKILCVVLICMASVVANAQTMCVRDKSLVISLDKSVGGTGNGNNASEMIWWADFPYGRIYGDATCLSAEEGLGRTTGMGAYYGTDDYANTPITAEAGLSGTDANGNDRKYCWSRATHPVSSRWVFAYANADSSACASDCANFCGRNVRLSSAKRVGVFGSVGI